MSRPGPDDALLGDVRALTARFKVGGPDAFDAFRALVDRLLRLTILAPSGGVRLAAGPRGADRRILGGWRGPDDPLPLNDGRFLRAAVTLVREPHDGGHRLKVFESSYQYQADQEGDGWIFRYDYLRVAPATAPGAHVQIRGSLAEPCLPDRTPLGRVHFPTQRVSLEAIIRLLVDDFGVPCHAPAKEWRPVLAATEREFLAIA